VTAEEQLAELQELFSRKCYLDQHGNVIVPAGMGLHMFHVGDDCHGTLVAVIKPGYDWSAYAGGSNDWSEEQVYRHAAAYGDKLLQEVADFLWPEMKQREELWRD
jgi:hypothetical protein